MLWLLLSFGIVIILGLAAYAWRLSQQVKQQQQRQQQEMAAAADQLREKQRELQQDISFVARAVLAEQCEITEGVMRIHHLLSGLDPDVWHGSELTTLRRHYDKTQHMPILDAYKKLDKKQQFQIDKQRWGLESEHKAAIELELQWLVAYQYPNVTLFHDSAPSSSPSSSI